MKFSMLPQPVGLLKLILNLHKYILKGESSDDAILYNI